MRINKQIIVLFAFSILTKFAFGQSQESFERLISKTNAYLKEYSKLSPFNADRLIALKDSGLPKEEIKYIKAHLEKYEGNSKDTITEFNLLVEFQGLIVEHITHLISHNKFKEHKIEGLINQNFNLSVTVSDDRKLYNFSLDEKTGGSYRSQISITHYTEGNLTPSLKSRDEREIINQYSVFEGDGFNGIYSIKTKEGIKYVLTGYVRGCSYCFETNIMLVTFKEGVFVKDFSYAVVSRNSKEGVRYDAKSKVIRVNYVTDDLTTNCNCSNDAELHKEQKNDSSNNGETGDVEKKCQCIFEFNELNFELIKREN